MHDTLRMRGIQSVSNLGYTELWHIIGAQQAKRKGDWVEVEIGIPQAWWQETKNDAYKKRLVSEIEAGFLSMVGLLQRNKHTINARGLLDDWRRIKTAYLTTSE